MTQEASVTNPDPLITALAADGFQTLAERILSGEHPTPTPGRGLPRVRGATLVPLLVHDGLCGYRGMVPQDTITPPVFICRGCGLAVPQEDADDGDNWTARTQRMLAATARGIDETTGEVNESLNLLGPPPEQLGRSGRPG